MKVLCTLIAVFIFGSAIGWSIYKESIEYLIEFLLGATFTLLIWIAITL